MQVIPESCHLIVGGGGPRVVRWRCEDLLTVSRHPGVLAVLLWDASMEGNEVYGRRASVLLAASPHLPLYLLFSQAAARPAEGGAEHDGETEAQHAQENPW